jgi:hypothetical protein
MKRKQHVVLLIVFSFCLLCTSSFASPPLFNYQGTLNDSAGKPVTGDKKMVFRIYPAVDTALTNALWTSIEMTVKVSNGSFSVNLGENPAFPANLFSEDNRYLGVSVEGTELIPRQKLVSVPYALQAGSAVFGGWPNSYPYIIGMSNAFLGSYNFCLGWLPTEIASNGTNCGSPDSFFEHNMIGFLGEDLRIRHYFNSNTFIFGYTDMFFINNPGENRNGVLKLDSCNDVAIYIGTGAVNRGNGGVWSLLYHRTPSPNDGGAGCPCSSLNPTINIPKGQFRLLILTRGSECAGYVVAYPYSTVDGLQMDWEGFRRYTGQY